MINISESDEAVTFDVRVVPRASKSEVIGEHGGALKVRLFSAPVDGAANAELVKLLAKYFGVSRGNVEIVAGEASKSKRIRIVNLSASRLRELI